MKKNNLPKFKSEEEERQFWASHDSTDYIDWDKAQVVSMPNLKPSVKSISLRLPEMMLDELKVLAHKKDVPYQSLIKMILAEKLEKELHLTH